jgi:hypothetical protein
VSTVEISRAAGVHPKSKISVQHRRLDEGRRKHGGGRVFEYVFESAVGRASGAHDVPFESAQGKSRVIE